MSSHIEILTAHAPLFHIRDECCDTCTGRRTAVRKLLYSLTVTLRKEREIDISEEICSVVDILLLGLNKHPPSKGTRKEVQVLGERDEYTRIML